ncbi:apoptosis inhibitory 5 [Gorgonomyces haynaldii]|nr:apoptosis inhibitory 5 [Gorgonomyces haynaldii]
MLTSETDAKSQFYEASTKLIDLEVSKSTSKDYVDSWLVVLSASSWHTAELRLLAVDSICKYFKYFKDHMDRAMDTFLDLCEDEDPQVRKKSIKQLIALSKEAPTMAYRVADVLSQLLQSDTPEDVEAAREGLKASFGLFPQVTIDAVMGQIEKGEEHCRFCCLQFLCKDLKSLKLDQKWIDLMSKQLVLVCHKPMKVPSVYQLSLILESIGVLNGYTQQLHLEKLIDTTIESIILDLNVAKNCYFLLLAGMPLFKRGITSDKLITFLCDKILLDPGFEFLDDQQLPLLRRLSDVLYFSPTKDALIKAGKTCQQLLPLFLPQDLNNLESALDFEKLEPLLHVIYKASLECEQVGLRFVYMKAAAHTDRDRLVNNCLAMSRELLKPVQARSKQDAHLSWKPSVTKPILESSNPPAAKDENATKSQSIKPEQSVKKAEKQSTLSNVKGDKSGKKKKKDLQKLKNAIVQPHQQTKTTQQTNSTLQMNKEQKKKPEAQKKQEPKKTKDVKIDTKKKPDSKADTKKSPVKGQQKTVEKALKPTTSERVQKKKKINRSLFPKLVQTEKLPDGTTKEVYVSEQRTVNVIY